MHGHVDAARGLVARGVRHRDGEIARQVGIRSSTVSAVLLAAAKGIVVVHRPLAVRAKRGLHIGKLHAVHALGTAADRGHAVGDADGPASDLDGTALAMQVHDERTAAVLAMAFFTAMFGLRAFVHHDLVVPDAGLDFTRIEVLLHRDRHGRAVSVLVRRRDRELLLAEGLVRIGRLVFVAVVAVTVVGHHQLAAVHIERRLVPLLRPGRTVDAQGSIRSAVSSEADPEAAGQRAVGRVVLGFRGIPLRSLRHHRHVVMHGHRDGRTVAVAIRIRHRHGQIMRDLRVRSGITLVMFRGVPVERIAEIQLARGRIIAGHGQGTFIRGNRVARERAVFKHGHVADDNGRHAVRGVDDQGSSGRDRSVGRAGSRAIGKAGFMDRHHFRSRIAIERSHSHAVIHPAIALIPGTGLHRVCGKLYTAVEADVQATQMVDAIQQVAAAIFVITAAARGTAAGGGTGSGHQVFAKGREEVLPADLHTFHLEGRHLFLGIGGVEALQLDGGAILESQDKIVAIAGQRRRICGKVEDEAPVRSAGNGLCGTSGRLGKTDIGHDGPPKKK